MDYKKICTKLASSFKQSFKKTGAKGAVIGISGGLDSSVAAAIICKALGNDKVFGYYMPYKTSSDSSYKDAIALSDALGFRLDIIKITDVVESFLLINWDEPSRVRKGNIMSRIRMTILFDKAAAGECIVAGTTNRTELLLGYGTWYGDTASSINVLGDLYKREVKEIASLLKVPKSIIDKEPSADLWAGQTDEKELGFSYSVIDDFLYSLEQSKLNLSELNKKFGKDTVTALINKVQKNAFKRSMPFICKTGIKGRKKVDEKLINKLMN